MIAQKTGVTPELQLLMMGGKVLKDDLLILSEYGITNLSTLELSGRLLGGMPRPVSYNVLLAAAASGGDTGFAAAANAARLLEQTKTNTNSNKKFEGVLQATYRMSIKDLCFFFDKECKRISTMSLEERADASAAEDELQAKELAKLKAAAMAEATSTLPFARHRQPAG
jgi:hypothetical protein